ncbi:MAG: selenium-binding protein [Gammaproteobacteria bacterium]|nr:selenium-binding protein [Gammaproteobacteria bacterium]
MIGACLLSAGALPAGAGETSLSPFTARITGQEDYAYVWTLGREGVGDGMDKLVTVDVNPASRLYGKVIHIVSVGGRHGALGASFTDDRRYLWAAGMESSTLFIFDVASDPRRPRLHRIIRGFTAASGGAAGPHRMTALPGRMLITTPSGQTDSGQTDSGQSDGAGTGAVVEYSNAGDYLATHWMPHDGDLRGAQKSGEHASGHGFDIGLLARSAVIVTSSLEHGALLDLASGGLAVEAGEWAQATNVVIWDLHSRKPRKVFDVPGAPLSVQCSSTAASEHCFTVTAVTAKLWLIKQDETRTWRAYPVAQLDEAGRALPLDLSVSADGLRLWVASAGDRKLRLFDVSSPHAPEPIFESELAPARIAQSFDGTRLYAASADTFEVHHWDGTALTTDLAIDFAREGLGRPWQVRFGASALYPLAAHPLAGTAQSHAPMPPSTLR